MDKELVMLILLIIAEVIAAIWGWAKARYHLKEGKKAKVVTIAEKAISQTYEEFVRGIKLATNNKQKLSAEDIATARSMAWNRACDLAKSEGIDFAKEVAVDYFPVLIDKIIKSVKKNK